MTLYFLAAANQFFALTQNGASVITERSSNEGWEPATKFPTFVHRIEYRELPIHLQLEPSFLSDLLVVAASHLDEDITPLPAIITAYINGERYINGESAELLAINVATKLHNSRIRRAA